VQEQRQVIKAHHLMEQAGQLVEQRGQITLPDGRHGNGEQGSVGGASGSCLSIEVGAAHGETPSRHRGESIIASPIFLRGAGGHQFG
jgi:hypothetical protein